MLFLYISQRVAPICHLTFLDRRALIFFDTDMPLPTERLFQNIMSKSCVRHILHHCDTGLHRSRDCSKGVAPILRNKDQLARQNMPQNNLCTAPAALACQLDVSIYPGFLMRIRCISYVECHILAATSKKMSRSKCYTHGAGSGVPKKLCITCERNCRMRWGLECGCHQLEGIVSCDIFLV